VYFVVESSDPASREGQQQLCGRFTTCMELSVANSLEAERKRPESSFLASPPASWMDDFLQWTNPTFESCCRVRRREPSVFCSPRDSDRLCRPCFEGEEWDITMAGLPENGEFMRYLHQWLQSPTDESCPLGGQAAYSYAVTLGQDNTTVAASHFRTYHTPLKTQNDFINALSAARRVSADITKRTGVKVFPYSLFYVFFDQYEHVESIAVQLIALGIFAIAIITSVLLGSWRTGGVVTFTCLLAVINVMGVMGYWGVSLNAISLVNLVISLGIAVEFCSHIARAFMGAGSGLPFDKDPSKERNDRAFAALVDVGPSVSLSICASWVRAYKQVFSGITMTKLIGISVLALTKSKLLEVYFFRMWLALILSGALHGLVLLPVLLSYLGGQGYSLEDTDEEWVTSQMRRP
jgi:Niemann-Pick C1 protein